MILMPGALWRGRKEISGLLMARALEPDIVRPTLPSPRDPIGT